MEDARAFLSDCGLPDYSLAGFRAPYLESDPGLRRALKNAKFEYDRRVPGAAGGWAAAGCSCLPSACGPCLAHLACMQACRGVASPTSAVHSAAPCPCSSLVEDGEKSITKDMTARVWPWNMATGIPIACNLCACLPADAACMWRRARRWAHPRCLLRALWGAEAPAAHARARCAHACCLSAGTRRPRHASRERSTRACGRCQVRPAQPSPAPAALPAAAAALVLRCLFVAGRRQGPPPPLPRLKWPLLVAGHRRLGCCSVVADGQGRPVRAEPRGRGQPVRDDEGASEGIKRLLLFPVVAGCNGSRGGAAVALVFRRCRLRLTRLPWLRPAPRSSPCCRPTLRPPTTATARPSRPTSPQPGWPTPRTTWP